ncbi:hypothetical protein [Aerosakkonema funiforme]|uniref:Uncharacterized protein n=1 Tax=Aerosakkonema funiforme FACHB-1375 TaxID=2949571 RepID=A0A926VBX5_9CYAN|nr:hypothetical protein [Aerosakkonema funiforme]MBD2179744.1 hypothetical protein [Aerosakkonema funiforme FACHB-1375]
MDNKLREVIGQVCPEIDLNGWKPLCPICANPIKIDVKSYFVFAQRHWGYGCCSSCDKKFLLDVPALLYNLWYPQIMDISTGEVYGTDSWWKADMYNIYFTFFGQKPVAGEKKNLRNLHTRFRTLVNIIKMGDINVLYSAIKKNFPILEKKWLTGNKTSNVTKKVKPTLKIISKNASNSDSVLLFNCLDEYYGHTTCFIEFVYMIYDRIGDKLKQQGIATAILIPEYLQFYVPDFIDEVWVATHLPSPFGRTTFRDVDFNNQLNEAIKHKKVFIPNQWINRSSGVDVRRYFHMDIVEQRAKISVDRYSHIFVFYNREDNRCWGGHPKKELRNYSKLANIIKNKYPSAGIFIVGMKRNYPLNNPNIIDWRTNGITENYTEKQIDYLYLLSKTDCAVGIHGSHMTEISALARAVITLQPESRYKNYTDDMFLIKSDDFIADLNRFYSIFGKNNLVDVSPEKVFNIMEAALHRVNYAYPSLKGYPSMEALYEQNN